MLDFALTQAHDAKNGGYRHSNFDVPGAPPANSKQWWIQMEGIHALVEVDRTCPEERGYMDALSDLWSYCQRFLFDQRHGGLYFEPLDLLPPRAEIWSKRHTLKESTRKGSVWKYVGHEGEALLAGLRRASGLPWNPDFH